MPLNLPQFEYKIKNEEGKTFLFDIIRKKYVVLTPEEWVRQHFVHYLINHFNYPKSLIKIESGHKFNKLQKRSDIIVYDREGKSFLMVECKAVSEKITSRTFDQIANYNVAIKAKYLVVSNGMKHYCYCVNFEDNQYKFLDNIPVYE